MENFEEQFDDLISKVTSFYNLDKKQVFSDSRRADIVNARHVLEYCLREKFKLSFPAIGKIFKRDHTSAIHAYNRIKKNSVGNNRLKLLIESLLVLEDNIDQEDIIIESANRDELKKYLLEKSDSEEKEFKELSERMIKKRNEFIEHAKIECNKTLKELKNSRENNLKQYALALNLIKLGNVEKARKILGPNKELITTGKQKKDRNYFLPRHKNNTQTLTLPLKFDTNYLRNVFSQLDNRSSSIIVRRYGFFDNPSSTLEEIATSENITRQRIKQILSSGLENLYYNNHGGIQQIIDMLAKKIIDEELVIVDDFVKTIYFFNENDEPTAIKFILVITSLVPWIKEFNFSDRRYFINNYDENKILEYIDQVKILIKKIDSAMPDLVADKWSHILNNLKMYEYIQNKNHLLNEKFLRSCYDNYLFESQIITYKHQSLKRFVQLENKNNDKTKGVPSEYNIFFK